MAYFEFLPVERDYGEVIQDLQCNGVSDQNCINKEDEKENKQMETVDLVDVKLGHYYELVVTTFTGSDTSKDLLEPLGFLLTEYTSFADTSSIPGHYVLFWELITRGNNDPAELDPIIMEQCCSTVEESLDSVYRRCRKKDKSIGPLEIRVVKHGTFDALMDFCLSQGSSVNQYKTPRCIKSEAALKILDSRVVGNFFSKKTPFWEPFRMQTE
ncbi:hypothetical protein GH714_007237 [Hevea brasiliensis]|uniref:Indole-3-acetic acid-amido synthetase GH3.17 n=1 Tax=Hevea brasiliensis TaxID=3981 RepID=A0A6A6KLU3_HEVBR|nr:hypothetical protein GH714_007237 [Hevea brasiliensis]